MNRFEKYFQKINRIQNAIKKAKRRKFSKKYINYAEFIRQNYILNGLIKSKVIEVKVPYYSGSDVEHSKFRKSYIAKWSAFSYDLFEKVAEDLGFEVLDYKCVDNVRILNPTSIRNLRVKDIPKKIKFKQETIYWLKF